MPPDLVKAHARLDALVDKAYFGAMGTSRPTTDAERVAHLFRLYAEARRGRERRETGGIG